MRLSFAMEVPTEVPTLRWEVSQRDLALMKSRLLDRRLAIWITEDTQHKLFEFGGDL